MKTTLQMSATHAATVETYGLGPCSLELADWPCDCDSKRKHPDHIVVVCTAHPCWWHYAPHA